MADGKKYYLNLETGEIIGRKSRLGAYIYFKADGKKVGYKVRWTDIVRYAPDGNC